MANALFEKIKTATLNGQLDWTNGIFKAALIDTAEYGIGGIVPLDLNNHEYLSDIPSAARIAESGAIANKSNVDGVLDADDITFPTVASGRTVGACVLYRDDYNNASTARLIAWYDSATGLPYNTNDLDVTIRWDDGPNKILKQT